MESEILNSLGIESFDPLILFIIIFVLLIVLIVLFIVNLTKYSALKARYEQFMEGRDAESLEDSMVKLFKDMNKLKAYANRHEKRINTLYEKAKHCYQKSALIKYDAFREMGGDLSFVIALLDEEDNGFILNSVHSTNSCYIYTKEIKNGQSFIDLGKEEAMALNKALSGYVGEE